MPATKLVDEPTGDVFEFVQPESNITAEMMPLKRYTEHTVAAPKALKVILSDVATQGWVVVDQELEEGLRSISVPLRDRSQRVMAALTICVHAARGRVDTMVEQFLPPLQRAAENISMALV